VKTALKKEIQNFPKFISLKNKLVLRLTGIDLKGNGIYAHENRHKFLLVARKKDKFIILNYPEESENFTECTLSSRSAYIQSVGGCVDYQKIKRTENLY
jgi:hypothetical protein